MSVHEPDSPARQALAARVPRSTTDDFERRMGVSVRALYELVSDLATARAGVYWFDLLASCAVGYVAFALAIAPTLEPWLQAICLVVSAAALYRAVLFIHELVHLPSGRFRAFRIAWNVLCGIPLLMPSFLYEVHMLHHGRRTYATAADGEYRAFAYAPRVELIGSVFVGLLAVPVLVVRFLVLAPLGLVFPSLRRRVLASASALVIRLDVPRSVPENPPLRWALQEAACSVYCALVLVLVASGWMPAMVVWKIYAVITLAVVTNALRVLCAHRYRCTGATVTFAEQVLDANNFPGGLAFLWAPLGLRYHAMHHLFPRLPYHALGEAYRRVMRALPADSALRNTCRSSFLAGLLDVTRPRGTLLETAHES